MAFICAMIFPLSTWAESIIHISPNGNDKAPGTIVAPIKTLQCLQAMLEKNVEIREVVFHDGVYSGTLSVCSPPTTESQRLPHLLLRAADNEKPIINGALSLSNIKFNPVDNTPGVYQTDATIFLNKENQNIGEIPSMWDRTARKRYFIVADLLAVKKIPASYTFSNNSLYLHTVDNQPPDKKHIEIDRIIRNGVLNIDRSDVTIKGLCVQNNSSQMFSSGFFVAQNRKNIRFENCFVFNCSRGFLIKGTHISIGQCRAEDVGCGILINGSDVLVEKCFFIRGNDELKILMLDPQEDTGIEVYQPGGGEISICKNVIKGFSTHGIFFKTTSPADFLVKCNTFIDNGIAIDWETFDKPWSLYKQSVSISDNIITGGKNATGIITDIDLKNKCCQINRNILWSVINGNKENIDYLNRIGNDNSIADPRFAAPEANDFRVLPDSPCIKNDKIASIGALEAVPLDFLDIHPPQINLAEQPSLTAVNNPMNAIPHFITCHREFRLRVNAHDAMGQMTQMSLRVDDKEWSKALPYANETLVSLPADSGLFAVSARVADNTGNWSAPATICVRAAIKPPEIIDSPTIRVHRNGIVISFLTDVECYASAEIGTNPDCGTALIPGILSQSCNKTLPASNHVLGISCIEKDPDQTWYYRIRIMDIDQKTTQEFSGSFKFSGKKYSYFVDPEGVDAENRGTRQKPWRTLQYAVNRALPGDQVIAMPGFYTQGFKISRGGVKDAPIVIQAQDKWKAVIDAQNKLSHDLVQIEKAPYVEITGLELRGFGTRAFGAICLDNSPYVAIRDCKIWNELRWRERRVGGVGIKVCNSPYFTVEKSLLFRLDYALILADSPSSHILYNTFRGFSHGGIILNNSTRNTVFRNNSINNYGNYAYVLHIVDFNDLKSFDADYNNLGTNLWFAWRDEPGVVPNLSARWGGGCKAVALLTKKGGTFLRPKNNGPLSPFSRAVTKDDISTFTIAGWEGPPVLRYKWISDDLTPPDNRGFAYIIASTFEDWQAFSGLDKHSIWADPRPSDPLNFDFRLLPDSPNIGAGEEGTTIGAMQVIPEKK